MNREIEHIIDAITYDDIAQSISDAENEYLDSLYAADQRRADIETPVQKLHESGWVIFDGLQASLAKRKLDQLVSEHDMVVGGLHHELLAGQTTQYDPDRMNYYLGEHLAKPKRGEEVRIMNSEIAMKSKTGLAVMMKASCLRSSEIAYIDRDFDEFLTPYDDDPHRSIKKRYRINYHETVGLDDR